MKTYGSKSATVPKALDVSSLFSSIENSAPSAQNISRGFSSNNLTAEERNDALIKKKRATPTALAQKSARRKISQTESRKELREEISKGHKDDLMELRRCLSQFQGGITHACIFNINIPRDWDIYSRERFKNWLVKIGFDEPSFFHPNICSLPIEKVDALIAIIDSSNLSFSDMSRSSSTTTNESIVAPTPLSMSRTRAHSEPAMVDSNANIKVIESARKQIADQKLPENNKSIISFGLSIDVSAPSFRLARAEKDDLDDLDLGSPWTSSSSNINLSRPGSTRTLTNPSPFCDSLISSLQDKVSLSDKTSTIKKKSTSFCDDAFRSAYQVDHAMSKISECDDLMLSPGEEDSPIKTQGSATSNATLARKNSVDSDSTYSTVLDENSFLSEDDNNAQSNDVGLPIGTSTASPSDLRKPPIHNPTVHFPDVIEQHQNILHPMTEYGSLLGADKLSSPSELHNMLNPLANHDELKRDSLKSAFNHPLPNRLHRSVTMPLGSSIGAAAKIGYNTERGDCTPGGITLSQGAMDYFTPQSKLFADIAWFYTKGADDAVISRLLKAANSQRAKSEYTEIGCDDNSEVLMRTKSAPVFNIPSGGGGKISYRPRDSIGIGEMSMFPNPSSAGHSRSSDDLSHFISSSDRYSLPRGRDRGSGAFEFDHLMSTTDRRNSSFLGISTPPDNVASLDIHNEDHLHGNLISHHQDNSFNSDFGRPRSQKKLRRSIAKRNRRRQSILFTSTGGESISGNFESSIYTASDISLNISADAIVLTKEPVHKGKKYDYLRRQSMAFRSKDVMGTLGRSLHEIQEEESFPIGASPAFDVINEKNSQINNLDIGRFLHNAVVIGGAFQRRFDNVCPVVTAPTSIERRVADIEISEAGELFLRMYIPQDNSCQRIELGARWVWLNCSPVGYLVTRRESLADKKTEYYYLPKHPLNWNAFKDPKTNRENKGLIQSAQSPIMYDFVENSFNMSHCSMESELDASSATSLLLPPEILIAILSHLTTAELSAQLMTVAKSWTIAIFKIFAERRNKSIWRNKACLPWKSFSTFLSNHSKGKFLSEGACKRVFCVRENGGALDAISIMDVDDLQERGMEEAINQELEISMLCSSLVSLNICPNMIRVHSVFQSKFDASSALWNIDRMSLLRAASDSPVVRIDKRRFEDGRYQYIQMEFCDGGDLEDFIRARQTIDVTQMKSFLFQMLFALYSAREAVSLRHFDIKLLNFFVASRSVPLSNSDLHIGFGKYIYRVPTESSHPSIIKLADFGTSVIGTSSMGEPIGVQQFTTLENTPPEFLLLGDSARQSHSADTFCLGLCFLHMLTGYAPYEELMKDVHCPAYLRMKLSEVWTRNNRGEPYYLIEEVMDSLEPCEGDEDSGVDIVDADAQNVLYDTMYRYLVLFCASPTFQSGFISNQLYEQNPVWSAIVHSLGLINTMTNTRRNPNAKQTRHKDHAQCIAAFSKDRQEWSIHQGRNIYIKNLQERIAQLGNGAMQLLDNLLHMDPSQRCSMYDALHHPIFNSMRVSSEQVPSWDLQYSYYYNRNGVHSVDDGLPLF